MARFQGRVAVASVFRAGSSFTAQRLGRPLGNPGDWKEWSWGLSALRVLGTDRPAQRPLPSATLGRSPVLIYSSLPEPCAAGPLGCFMPMGKLGLGAGEGMPTITQLRWSWESHVVLLALPTGHRTCLA